MTNKHFLTKKTLLILLTILFFEPTLFASNASALYYQHCDSCHGKNGKVKAMKVSAQIAGIGKAELVSILQKYKNGTLDKYGQGFLMTATTSKLTAADIDAISAFVSELK